MIREFFPSLTCCWKTQSYNELLKYYIHFFFLGLFVTKMDYNLLLFSYQNLEEILRDFPTFTSI